jgi:hypothetical protein
MFPSFAIESGLVRLDGLRIGATSWATDGQYIFSRSGGLQVWLSSG